MLVVLLAAGVGAGLYVRSYFASGEPGGEVTVTIPEGASLREIAALLEQSGVVRRAKAFEIRAETDGYASSFRAGAYRLHVNQPYDSLIAVLLEGTAPATVKVTVPEGSTARQAGDLLAGDLQGFSAREYVDLTLVHPLPFALQGLGRGGSLEGMLFPATYDVEPSASPRQVIGVQLVAFKDALGRVDMGRAHSANLTSYDVTIIASMVEREIQVASERPLAAAVIWNRLRLGMPLQIDATIQYGLPEYKEDLTYEDLRKDSPYNTYTRHGLPPTPIANPGLAALRAAAAPARVDYLYYVARNDGSGRHFFSSSYSQFLKDKARAEQ